MDRTHTGYDPRAVPVPRPPQSSQPPAGDPRVPRGAPVAGIPIADLRHPTEPSRFALALVAMALAVGVALFVMVSLGQVPLLIKLGILLILAVLVIWVLVQVLRIRLLGDAVLVSRAT